MTYNECKELLKSIKRNRALLRSIEKKLAEDDRFIFISAIDYSKPVVKGGIGTTKQEQYCELSEKIEGRKKVLKDQAEQLMCDIFLAEDTITGALPSLTPLEQEIIIECYLNGESNIAVAKKNNYSLQHIKKLKNRAVKKIASLS